ncbi:hypothetical protein [Pseudomonas syringae]|uniref:hypothetical protein n=1 Tax=Pseudomonas syringae TaxID=317 RepID=UPI001BCAD311|nr:hypothetical protein [Pseudomonas syringae]MBS7459220.1 hypothetical protein [Pseudomonas syringae]
MIKLNRCALIDSVILTALEKYPVDIRPARWDGRAKAVKSFKDEVMTQGLVIQSQKCAWCTLSVGPNGRRTAHRDHIAPKAKHPQWTFLAINLVIACEYCNGFSVKGEIDTIQKFGATYEDCEFLAVHPYLDEPADHLEFVGVSGKLPVVIRSDTSKGLWTIKYLQLDTPGATLERAKDRLWEEYNSDLSLNDQSLIAAASAGVGYN